jgi:hypothetical protein
MARYPNCIPETELCFADGHEKNGDPTTTSASKWKAYSNQTGSQSYTAPQGTVRVSRLEFTLEDAIGSHACSLEALPCV